MQRLNDIKKDAAFFLEYSKGCSGDGTIKQRESTCDVDRRGDEEVFLRQESSSIVSNYLTGAYISTDIEKEKGASCLEYGDEVIVYKSSKRTGVSSFRGAAARCIIAAFLFAVVITLTKINNSFCQAAVGIIREAITFDCFQDEEEVENSENYSEFLGLIISNH